METLGRLCLIGDTPDFGGLRNAAEFLAVCRCLFPSWQEEQAGRLMTLFGLPLKKPLKGYSRGMQTALLLCAGLASGAELTIFDEPSLGLDAVMRERFYDEVVAAHRREPERTFLISTHLIDEVARTLDYAVMIDGGRLLAQGSPEEMTRLYLCVSGLGGGGARRDGGPCGPAGRRGGRNFGALYAPERAGGRRTHSGLRTGADRAGEPAEAVCAFDRRKGGGARCRLNMRDGCGARASWAPCGITGRGWVG